MKRWVRWLWLGPVWFALLLPARADDAVIVFTAEPTRGPQGEIRQLRLWEARLQLITELAQAAGFAVSIQPLPWRRAQDMALAGAGLLWGVSATPERISSFMLSEAVLAQPVWVVSRASEGWEYRRIADLRDKLVSIPLGARYPGEFESERGHLFKVEEKSLSLSSRLQMLARQRVDVLVFGSLRSTRQAAQSYVDCYYGRPDELRVSPTALNREGLHIAAARGSALTELIPRINQGLSTLKRQGRLQALLDAFDTAKLDDCVAEPAK